jgi:para-aminobenzoate synthetase component 1
MEFPVYYFNSNDGTGLLAIGKEAYLRGGNLSDLQLFADQHAGKYIFGCLSYDLKNELFEGESKNADTTEFPDLLFLVPELVIKFEKEQFKVLQGRTNPAFLSFVERILEEETDNSYRKLNFDLQPRTTRERYIDQVKSLQKEIQFGNIYEVNYCQEFYAENCKISDPIDTYFKLNSHTKAPFSGFVHLDEFSVFCASPERYIKKTGSQLISQPIKGTAPRSSDPPEDEQLKNDLYNSPKERSENVMIVDLVRNDLSKIATKNSVNVDELFGIYSFPTVHQMISTVSCEVKEKKSFTDILRATFPMGSMTGAPKEMALKLIEAHEDFKRGLYSGSIGYIDPEGNFDFNVVIRSAIYNDALKTISCSVGSAITIASDPEKEYEECQVKIGRLLKALNE